MSSLKLIDRLCGCFETHQSNAGDEAASEMIRVIRAIAEKGKCALLADGPVAKVLASFFREDQELWNHVEVLEYDGP
jgi:hypothetical protein